MKGTSWVSSAFFLAIGVFQIAQPSYGRTIETQEFPSLCAKADRDESTFKQVATLTVKKNRIEVYALNSDVQLIKTARAPEVGPVDDTAVVAVIESGKNAEIPRIKFVCHVAYFGPRTDDKIVISTTLNTTKDVSVTITFVLDKKTVKYSVWKLKSGVSIPANDAVWMADPDAKKPDEPNEPDPAYWPPCLDKKNTKHVVADDPMKPLTIQFDICSPAKKGEVTYKYSLRMDQSDPDDKDNAKTVVIIDPQIINQVH